MKLISTVLLILYIPMLWAFISIVVWTLRLGISPMPSSHRAREAMLALLKEHGPREGQLYELGAGWGTLAFPIARRFPHYLVHALERSTLPRLWMHLLQNLDTHDNLVISADDIHERSLEQADVVVCYLYTDAMTRLSTKLCEELPPGALILTHTFALPHWQASRVVILDDLYKTRVYMYFKSEDPSQKEPTPCQVSP